MLAYLEVIVTIYRGVTPRCDLESCLWQQPQRWLIEALEQLTPARATVCTHRAFVQIFEQLSDPCVERREREERFIAQACEHPTLCDLHRDLDLGLVFGLARTRGHNRRPVVLRPLRVRTCDARFVPARCRHGRLQLIRDNHRRHAP
jgi:hypothetical protein